MSVDPTRTVSVDPEHAARVISDFADSLGLPVPTTAAEVVTFLDRQGYAITPRVLEEFREKRYISDPGEVWDAVSVYCLAGALESRRRWKPTPNPVHDAKKSGARLQLEQLRNEGVNPPINDLDRYTLEDLLIQLTQSDNRTLREIFYETIREKLRGYEE